MKYQYDNLMIKFIWKKRTKVAKKNYRKNRGDSPCIKIYFKPTGIQSVVLAHTWSNR